MAPMITIYTETTPLTASSNEARENFAILTTPRLFLFCHARLPGHRFWLENAAFIAWKMGDSRSPPPDWIGTVK